MKLIEARESNNPVVIQDWIDKYLVNLARLGLGSGQVVIQAQEDRPFWRAEVWVKDEEYG